MKTSYTERNYPTFWRKNLPNSLRTLMQKLCLLHKTFMQCVLSFLSAYCKELKASQCYENSDYHTEFLSVPLQIICNNEGKWKGGLNPEQFFHNPTFRVSWPSFPHKLNTIKSQICLTELNECRRLYRPSCFKRNAFFHSTSGCSCGTLINLN